MSAIQNIHELGSDSGLLLAIHGDRDEADRYHALALVFSNGVMTLRCDIDTDEVLVTTGHDVPGDLPHVAPDEDENLSGLEGMVLEYVWIMINHRGYRDGLQIRLLNLNSREEQVRQFEVMASAMTVRRVC